MVDIKVTNQPKLYFMSTYFENVKTLNFLVSIAVAKLSKENFKRNVDFSI